MPLSMFAHQSCPPIHFWSDLMYRGCVPTWRMLLLLLLAACALQCADYLLISFASRSCNQCIGVAVGRQVLGCDLSGMIALPLPLQTAASSLLRFMVRESDPVPFAQACPIECLTPWGKNCFLNRLLQIEEMII